VLELGDILIYVIHDIAGMDVDPRAAGFQVVVFGHSHRPICELREGVLFVNPGSAGPRRFTLPISVGRLVVSGAKVEPQLVELHPGER
jgi:predicted phosphodiesterase